jgi:MoxR-like ATPase
VVGYAVRLVRSTRPEDEESPESVRGLVSWGAGPRASQYLTLGAKALAAMDGRGVPNYEDVRAVAPAVLRHRVVTNFQAEAEGRNAADIVDELLQLSRKWT